MEACWVGQGTKPYYCIGSASNPITFILVSLLPFLHCSGLPAATWHTTLTVLSSWNAQRPTWFPPLPLSTVASSEKSCPTIQHNIAPYHPSLQPPQFSAPFPASFFSTVLITTRCVIHFLIYLLTAYPTTYLPLEYELHERKSFLSFGSLLYYQHLELCLPH